MPDATLLEAGLVRLKGRKGATRVFTALPSDAMPSSEHTAFLEAFQQARFAEAAALLTQLEANTPSSLHQLYHHYRERLEAAQAAPPAFWDGVYDPDRK